MGLIISDQKKEMILFNKILLSVEEDTVKLGFNELLCALPNVLVITGTHYNQVVNVLRMGLGENKWNEFVCYNR
jgi:hypothetical protein